MAGDAEMMYAAFTEDEEPSPENQNFVEVMIHQPNRHMVEAVENLIRQTNGPHLVLVGAGHLGGDQGMLELLHERGFEIQQLRRNGAPL